MQVAKMFASMGFKVDTTGLDRFKKSIADARHELTNLGNGAKTSTRQLRNLKRSMADINTQMGKIKGTAATKAVRDGYKNIAGAVRRLDNALTSISSNQPRITKALGKIHASVKAGEPLWDSYRRSVVQTRRAILNLNQEITRLRSNSRVNINVNRRENNYGGGGGGHGGIGLLGGFAGGAGLRGLFSSMLPSAALAGGTVSAGYLGKHAIEASRDQTRMESMIQMTSRSAEEYARTIDFVREESMRLGLSSVELGRSFSQISMSARSLTQQQKEEMFTGMSEFMMSVGTGADDQKGIFRAVNQMFSYNRILQEEINQLSERGIPATLVYDAAMKAYGKDSVAEIKKMQEDGKLDPKLVLTEMARMMQGMAHDSGAYDKMMNSSIVKQGQFMNQLSLLSKDIMDSGLDEALGSLFGKLTDIAANLSLVVDGVKGLVEATSILVGWIRSVWEWFDRANGGWGVSAVVLLLLFSRFKQVFRVMGFVARAARTNAGVMRTLAGIFTGVFGRALGQIILRFSVWTLGIWAAYEALKFLGDQLKRSSRGEWTFFDEIFAGAERAGAQIELLIARIKLGWANMKVAAMNPFDFFANQADAFEERIRPNRRGNNAGSKVYKDKPVVKNLPTFQEIYKNAGGKRDMGGAGVRRLGASNNAKVIERTPINIYIDNEYKGQYHAASDLIG